MVELDFETVDVFADRAFAGNPLAVVRGAGALSTAQLQAIASEFNLSETAFPMVPTPAQAEAGAAYRLRIFTPLTELPFAGHPSVGTAWVLAQHGLLGAGIGPRSMGGTGQVLQACPAGLVTVQADASGGRISAAASATHSAPVTAVPVADARAALSAVGLEPADLVDRHHGASYVASAGLPFWFLLVREGAVLRAQASLSDMIGLAAPQEVSGTSLARLGGVATVAWSDAASTAHSRVFCPDIGTVEDPATGSAALALSAVLVLAGRLSSDGRSSYVVRQGAEIGRPSTMPCDLDAAGGRVTNCFVGGKVVPVSSGRIRIPDLP
jgi:trans-2,3-dihydro-3-hydroxyanthranilate isomerase